MESMSKVRYHIATRIKELREQRKWSQEELGDMFEVAKNKGTVSSWEKGRTTPDADTLVELCEIFGVDISTFYPSSKDDDDEIVLTKKERLIVEWYRSSGYEGRAAIEATAKAMSNI